ncbi:MAG TPA: 6-phosphogluconolactonase [Vicinamibacterales bacterium]|nr:6-phosphogluconolactonase [Vicinamibacterales bacterium]
MSVEVEVHRTDVLGAIVAGRVERIALAALAGAGRVAVALTGGSLAEACFPALSKLPLDWSRVEFFWGDERAVPPEHPESNYGAAARLWLEPAGVPAARIHRLPADDADLAAAALRAEQELVATLGRVPRLDLALLGLGPDGHVCSLFPGHPLLLEDRRWVAAVEDSPKPPPRRLTLTRPTLTASAHVLFVASGSSKAAAVHAAVLDEHSRLPVALVAREAARALFVLDDAAARML